METQESTYDANSTLNGMVSLLAASRREFDEAKAKLDAARKLFDEQNAALIAEVSEKKNKAEVVEAELRTMAVSEFATTGEKKPHAAIEVKMFDAVVYDTAAALNWARLFMPGLLALDSRAYEKLLKEVHNSKTLADVIKDMPGEVKEGPKATIARDLSGYEVK